MPPSSESLCTGTQLLLPDRREGKVRDSYSLGPGKRLLITTDRLSAFDRVLGCVAHKGQVLNQLSNWWFARTRDIVPNHLLEEIDPNAIIAIEASPLPIEVVVRGYITGVTKTSLWYRYELGEREIYGHRLPEGLVKNQALPEPLVTPTTKGGPTGHDERLSAAQVVEGGFLTAELWQQVQSVALALFRRGQQLASERALVLVDTKYEFGLDANGALLLIDELHTPDSSRYWRGAPTLGEPRPSGAEAQTGLSARPQDEPRASGARRRPGCRLAPEGEPESLDKEFLRLAYAERGYRGEGEPPTLPGELWERVSTLYREVFERLTGQSLVPATGNVEERLVAILAGKA